MVGLKQRLALETLQSRGRNTVLLQLSTFPLPLNDDLFPTFSIARSSAQNFLFPISLVFCLPNRSLTASWTYKYQDNNHMTLPFANLNNRYQR